MKSGAGEYSGKSPLLGTSFLLFCFLAVSLEKNGAKLVQENIKRHPVFFLRTKHLQSL
jgi:hypothetical protein